MPVYIRYPNPLIAGAVPVDLNDGAGNPISSNGGALNENLTQVGNVAITLGQKAMAASLPVVIASDQSNIATTDAADGSTGAAVPAKAAYIGINVAGNLTGATGTVNGLKVDGSAVTQPVSGTVTANQGGAPWTQTIVQGGNTATVSAAGALKTDSSATTQPVSGTVSATQGTSPWVDNLTQVGGSAITLGQKTSANSMPVVIASDQSAVPVSGTVTANIGTTGGLALDTSVTGLQVAQGSTTAGETGPLVQGAVTTAAPVYVTGKTDPLSLTTAGALRVDGSAVTQPVSGTVTSNIGTTGGLALDASVTGLQVSQGSATAGQNGGLALGAVTTAAPVYVTGQSDPLSLTTAGALRTDSSGSTQPVSGTVTANQGTSPWVENLTQVGGSAITLGQAAMAASLPVVIASNQTNLPTNLTQIGGAALALGTATTAASIPVTLASNQGSITVSNGLTQQPPFIRNDYTITPVTSAAYVQLVASLGSNVKKITLFDSSGYTLKLALGGAGSEVDQLVIPPGGFNGEIDFVATAGQRLSIKAIATSATAGEIDINLFN